MDSKYCPICEEENECMTRAGEHGNCWCFTEVFSSEIYEIVPKASRGKYCICKKCLYKYREEQKI